MEATGRSDNLKTIVGMLLKKEKSTRPGATNTEATIMEGRKTIPKVAIISAPQTPTATSPTDSKAPLKSIIAAPVKISAAKARFIKVAKKVIIRNRKLVAIRAIENARAYLAQHHARTGFHLKSNDHRRSSMYGLHTEV